LTIRHAENQAKACKYQAQQVQASLSQEAHASLSKISCGTSTMYTTLMPHRRVPVVILGAACCLWLCSTPAFTMEEQTTPVVVSVQAVTEPVQTAGSTNFSISFAAASGMQSTIPPSSFIKNHERLLHVVAVGGDLNTFVHKHPEDQGFKPAGGTLLSIHGCINTRRKAMALIKSVSLSLMATNPLQRHTSLRWSS